MSFTRLAQVRRSARSSASQAGSNASRTTEENVKSISVLIRTDNNPWCPISQPPKPRYSQRMRTLLAGALLACMCIAADESLPKAESILDRSVEATGGRAAYDKIHNAVEAGTFELPAQGVTGTATIYTAEPDKNYQTIEIEGVGKFEAGSNG